MQSVSVRGTDLYYESVGEGDPLVLVHGGFLDHTMWFLNVPLLAERFRVVTIDMPGHGQSGGRLDPAIGMSEAVDMMVGYLVELVERLGVAPAYFAGQSSGGAFILHLAARRPDLVRALSLHEPAIVALLENEFHVEREMQREASVLLASGDVEGGLARFVASVGGDWSAMPEPFKAIFRHNAPAYAGMAFFDDPTGLPVPDGLGSFPHPVQFTRGDRSPRFFHASIEKVVATMTGAEVVTIPGGHAAMLEHPAEYCATLTEFFERAHADVRR